MAPTINWCWTSFPAWQISSLVNLQHVQRKLKQTLAIWCQHGTRVCFSFLWIYGRSNTLETCQVILALICLKKTNFGFCWWSQLMQLKFVIKTLCTENQIAQLPRQLEGWLRWQIKIFSISTTLWMLQCELSCMLGGKVAQTYGKKLKLKLISEYKPTFFKYKLFCRTGNPG